MSRKHCGLLMLAMLTAGEAGPFAAVARAVTGVDGQPSAAAGLLSAFLDNAPTDLVFFNLAGGEAQRLMTTRAEGRGVQMPSFFGDILWSGVVLLPLSLLMTRIWF